MQNELINNPLLIHHIALYHLNLINNKLDSLFANKNNPQNKKEIQCLINVMESIVKTTKQVSSLYLTTIAKAKDYSKKFKASAAAEGKDSRTIFSMSHDLSSYDSGKEEVITISPLSHSCKTESIESSLLGTFSSEPKNCISEA